MHDSKLLASGALPSLTHWPGALPLGALPQTLVIGSHSTLATIPSRCPSLEKFLCAPILHPVSVKTDVWSSRSQNETAATALASTVRDECVRCWRPLV